MSFQEVTRLPDRQMVTFCLLEGGGPEEWHRGKPGVTKIRHSRAEVPKRLLGEWPYFRHVAKFTMPDPKHPQAKWFAAWWVPDCDTFDTPSKNLEPGMINITGKKVMWWSDSEDASPEVGSLDDVDVTRDGSNRVTDIKRKQKR